MTTKQKAKNGLVRKDTIWHPADNGDISFSGLTYGGKVPTGPPSRRVPPSSSKDTTKVDDSDDSADPMGLLPPTKRGMAKQNNKTYTNRPRNIRPKPGSEDALSEEDKPGPSRPTGRGSTTRVPPTPDQSTKRDKKAATKAKTAAPKAGRTATAPFPMGAPPARESAPLPVDFAAATRKNKAKPFPMAAPERTKKKAVGSQDAMVISDDDDQEEEEENEEEKKKKKKEPQEQSNGPKVAPFPMAALQKLPSSFPADSLGSSFHTHRSKADDASSDDINREPRASSPSGSSGSSSSSQDSEGSKVKNTRSKGVSNKRTKPSASKSKISGSTRDKPQAGPSYLQPSLLSPSRLCPYCDEELPLSPSSNLRKLLKAVQAQSEPAPRPSNPRGRDAPIYVSIAVCTVHRAESSTIPEGLKRGWPGDIDFDAVSKRLGSSNSKRRLENILKDRAEGGRGFFWNEACKDVKAHGTRAANSIQGQMETFEAIQPGYYGERGVLVITSALQDMFPLDSINARLTAPLAPADFIRRVLLPEAAVLLIKKDLSVNPEEARQIMKESWAFGLALYPTKDGDGDTSIIDLSMVLTPQKDRTKGKEKERAASPVKSLRRTRSLRSVDQNSDARRPSSPAPGGPLRAKDPNRGLAGSDTENELAAESDRMSISAPKKPRKQASQKDVAVKKGDSRLKGASSKSFATPLVASKSRAAPSTKGRQKASSPPALPIFTSLEDDVPQDAAAPSYAASKQTGKKGKGRSAASFFGEEDFSTDEDDTLEAEAADLFGGSRRRASTSKAAKPAATKAHKATTKPSEKKVPVSGPSHTTATLWTPTRGPVEVVMDLSPADLKERPKAQASLKPISQHNPIGNTGQKRKSAEEGTLDMRPVEPKRVRGPTLLDAAALAKGVADIKRKESQAR